MKVLIVAKTRRGKAACVGGITEAGQSVRLINPADHEQAGQEYNVGEVWQIEGESAPHITPPHTENFMVRRARRLPNLVDLVSIVEQQMPPHHGPPHYLFDELCQTTASGSLYIAKPSGISTHSTTFWRPDVDLIRADEERRIRYRYDYTDGDERFPNGCTLVFVGYQDPLPIINAGTLLRVSMSHWWTPPHDPSAEKRCYVQLSGWFETDLGQGKGQSGRTFRLANSAPKPLPPIIDDGSPISWPGFDSATDENLVIYPFEDDVDTFLMESNGSLNHEVDHDPAPPDEASQTPSKINGQSPHEVLKNVFGYDEFRPLQLEIIHNILNQRDTLVVMPTGGGKSLCYQLPALLMDGLTVVVSPLISLMQDQVNQLRALGVPAVYLNSTLTNSEYIATAQRVRNGENKLLYLAPETLLRPETLVLLEKSNLIALVIDEAHCISQWGHDFRPEYRQIVMLRDRFPETVCAALTATATPRVQDDIKQTLEMSRDDTFIAGFDRPNLYIGVRSKRDIFQQTVDFLAQHPNQSGIIYCNTRRRVDELNATLNQSGFSALPYHGGLEMGVRQHNQDTFIRDDVPIMVATVAFGMGINKPDVRFVLHVDLPKNMEHYYQQIGRAGRDGLSADCVLLYSYGDVSTIAHFINQGAESEADGRRQRLDQMVSWAESGVCRRKPLLAYFGETYAKDNCEGCDNCLRSDEDAVDLTLPAQKFLSCVARTEQLFGADHIIKILRGSQAKKILANGHNKLSTHAIGREYSANQWKDLVTQFIRQGLVSKDKRYGSLKLTDKAHAVLKGEKVFGVIEEEPNAVRMNGKPLAHNVDLYQQLRRLRKTLADRDGMPPYMIMSDHSLQEMATFFPHSAGSLQMIHGVGEVKCAKYGEAFLDQIRTFCAENDLEEVSKPKDRVIRVVRSKKSRLQEVGEAFYRGETVADLMALYRVKRSTILNHLVKYSHAVAENENEISIERLRAECELSNEELAQIHAAFEELGPTYLSAVYSRFDGRISYDELRMARVLFELAS